MELGTRWNPWETLRRSPWITFEYAALVGASATVTERSDGGYHVLLDERLGRVERRCALAHELAHVELGRLFEPGTAACDVMRGELVVKRWVADRLIPEQELRSFVRRHLDMDEMCLARDVAAEFDTTVEIADLALRRLEDKVRSGGLHERARLSA